MAINEFCSNKINQKFGKCLATEIIILFQIIKIY